MNFIFFKTVSFYILFIPGPLLKTFWDLFIFIFRRVEAMSSIGRCQIRAAMGLAVPACTKRCAFKVLRIISGMPG